MVVNIQSGKFYMNSDEKKIFRRRFYEYYEMLCKIAYGYIPDKYECEDIVQETFISFWNIEKELMSEKDFCSYMAVAVRNKCISYLRKRRLCTVSIEESEYAVISSNIAYEEYTDKDEISSNDKLHHVLSVLPPRCKEVFVMSKLHGLKYREIAVQLDISEKTVENQMVKAVKILREFICKNSLVIFIITFVSNLINDSLR